MCTYFTIAGTLNVYASKGWREAGSWEARQRPGQKANYVLCKDHYSTGTEQPAKPLSKGGTQAICTPERSFWQQYARGGSGIRLKGRRTLRSFFQKLR